MNGYISIPKDPYKYSPFPPDYDLKSYLIEYSKKVVSGEYYMPTCEKHKWSCLRFLQDIEMEGTERFPYVFNSEKAVKFLNWMKIFKHIKGELAGQRINPHDIQIFTRGNIYGWEHKDTGKRRFRKSYWQTSRKNAKTQTNAATATYELSNMVQGISEVYIGATNREQANILWEDAVAMVEGCSELNTKFDTAYHKLIHKKSNSKMSTLSKDSRKSGDGTNPQCGIIEEYHAHPTDEAMEIIESGMGMRPEPLIDIITTPGFNLDYPCYAVEYKLVKKILDPNDPYRDETYFAMVNELDEYDDPMDEKVWGKSNPIRATFPEGIQYIRNRARQAEGAPEKMVTFLTKDVGMWVDSPEAKYLEYSKYEKSKIDKLPFPFTGRSVYIGVDLADKIDLCSLQYEFPDMEHGVKKWYFLNKNYIPRETMARRQRLENKPYNLWATQGYVTPTDNFNGELVDYRRIIHDIDAFCKTHYLDVVYICVDPRGANMFMQELSDLGYNVLDIFQGNSSMDAPVLHYREQLNVGNVLNVANPVMDEAAKKAEVATNSKGEMRLDKNRNEQGVKIDPLAAAMCCHKLAMNHDFEETQEVFTEAYFETLWGNV
jgi:phage terminase large subunit-like protein